MHGIVPRSVRKKVTDSLSGIIAATGGASAVSEGAPPVPANLAQRLTQARREMLQAAGELDFERAIRLRDEVRRLEALQLELASP